VCYHQRNPPFRNFAYFFCHSLARSLLGACFGRFEERNFGPIASDDEVEHGSQRVIRCLVLLVVPVVYQEGSEVAAIHS
jgi:hypothetical protein